MAQKTKRTQRRIDELERNDVEGALNIAKDLLEKSEFTEDIAETLTMLQDDPAEYWEKFSKLQDSLEL
jgi:DNA-directed RNA polymerase subunit F